MMYLLHLLTSITSFSKILISAYLLAHFVSFGNFLPIFFCFVGDIVIDQNQSEGLREARVALILINHNITYKTGKNWKKVTERNEMSQ